MKGRNFYAYLLLVLCLLGTATHGRAQTITSVSFSPAGPFCAGSAITVTFSTTGTFGNGNVFTAQLLDATGSSVNIGTTSGNSRTIAATLPKSTLSSSEYRIRVTSSSPAKTATGSTALTVNALPGAPTTSSKSYCVGDAASASDLVATPDQGGTLVWYSQNAPGGTALPGAPTPATSSNGTTTYYVGQTVNGCASESRSPLVVTVNAVPAAPTSSASTSYCAGATAAVLSANGQGLKWYTAATGGIGSSAAPIPSTTSPGTTNYYVSQTVNGCESPRTTLTIQVKESPTAPAFAPAPAYCQSQTAVALSATPSGGATLNWYGTNAAGGTASATPNTPATSQSGTINYYVSQSINGCEGPRAAIPVTVKATPAAPTIGGPANLCQNRTSTALTATPAVGGTLNWYGTNAAGGTASPTAPTPPTSTVGGTTYYVSQTVNGCEGPRAGINAVVYAVPSQPTSTTLPPVCEGSAGQVLSASGQNLRWYGTNVTGGSASSTPSTVNTSLVGLTNYYVTQTVNGCESERAAIPVRVKDTPDAPTTSNVSFCQSYPASPLTATFAGSTTATWFDQSGKALPGTPTPPNASAGDLLYYVTQTLDGCESPRASLKVHVKATPGAPSTSPIGFCNNGPAQQLTAIGENGSTIKWFDGSDNLLNGAPIPATNTVGDQLFKATQTSAEGCESLTKATLVVTIKPLPVPPGVTNVNYCQSQQDQPNQNIGPLTANGQGLRWYNTDGNPFPNAPTPTTERTGVQAYQVSQTVNGCEGGKATIQVTINTTPAPTVPKPLVTYCINDKATPLVATGDLGGSLRWIDPYGRVSNDAPTPATTNTNVKPDGDPFYVYQIGQNGCYSPRSTIKVVVNTTPTLALTSPVTSVNLGQKAQLQLKFTGSGPYSYTLTGGYSGISRTSDTTILVLPRGNTTYQIAAVTNGCGIGLPGNPATATITVRVPTVETSSLASSTLCAGTPLVVPFVTTGEFNPGNAFRIELANAADTTKKYDVVASSDTSPVQGTLPLALPGGQYYVRIKALNPEIGITGSNSPTLLTVRSLPTATLTGSQNIYEGTPANLTIAFGGEGPWGLVYADSLRSYSTTATANPLVVEVRPARTTTYRITSVTNVCGTGAISGSAVVSVLPLLGIEDNSLDPLVKAYPVPTTTLLTVDLDLPLTKTPAVLSLTDLRGRSVLQHTTRSHRTELNLASQPSGLYILHIQVGDRQTVRKVLKQ